MPRTFSDKRRGRQHRPDLLPQPPSLQRGFGPRLCAGFVDAVCRACVRYTADRVTSHTPHTRANDPEASSPRESAHSTDERLLLFHRRIVWPGHDQGLQVTPSWHNT
jgi:hypothetical protein